MVDSAEVDLDTECNTEQRKASDAEAKAIGSFYSDARKRAKATGRPTWTGD